MIWGALVAMAAAVLRPLFAVMPVVDLSGLRAGSQGITDTVANSVWLNGLFPVVETWQVVGWALTLYGATLVYEGANWVYRHLPEVWGFGPGPG